MSLPISIYGVKKHKARSRYSTLKMTESAAEKDYAYYGTSVRQEYGDKEGRIMDTLLTTFDLNDHHYGLYEKPDCTQYLKSYSAKAKMTVIMPIDHLPQDVSLKQKANELRDFILAHFS